MINERTPTPPSNGAISDAYRELKAAEAEESEAVREMLERAPKNPLIRPNALLNPTGYKEYKKPIPEEAESAAAEHREALGAFYTSDDGQRLAERCEIAGRRHSAAVKAFEESWRSADEAKSNALKLASDIIEFKKIREERGEGGGA